MSLYEPQTLIHLIESAWSNQITRTIVILTAVVFFSAAWWLLRPIRQASKGFGEATLWLKKRSRDTAENPGVSSLGTEVSKAVEGMRGAEKLSRQLKLYERAWRENSLDINGRQLSSVDTESYFESHQVLPDGFQWMIIRMMPGVLTTMGILGTFVGISFGLAQLQSGFRSGGDFGPMQEGVLGLMGGMSTAFLTSIFGILFSLVWIYGDRQVSKGLSSSRAKFLDALEMVLPTADIDTLWRYSLQISNDQRTSIKTLATDIATNLVEGLNQSSLSKLAPEFTQMRQAFEQFSSANHQIQVEGMERMIERFGDLLGERMKGQFDNLATTIEMICDWQRQTKENLDQLLVKLQEATDQQSQMLKRSIEAGEIFQNSLGDLGKIHDQLQSALTRFEALSGDMQTLGGLLGKSDAAIRDAAEQMAGSLSTTMTEFGQLSAGYRQGFDEQLRSIDKLTQATRSQAERLDERLRTSMEKFTDDCQTGVGKTFSEFDKHLSQLTSALSGTVQETNDVMELVRKSLEKVRLVSEDVHGATEGLKLGTESFAKLVNRLADGPNGSPPADTPV